MNKNKGMIGAVVAVVVIAVVGALALGGGNKTSTSDSNASNKSDSSSVSAPANATATDAVTISDYKFGPMDITVKVGTKVTWTNQDAVHHNITTDDGSAVKIDGPLIGKGETFSYTFAKAGTYSYHCTPHPYMKATVTVTN